MMCLAPWQPDRRHLRGDVTEGGVADKDAWMGAHLGAQEDLPRLLAPFPSLAGQCVDVHAAGRRLVQQAAATGGSAPQLFEQLLTTRRPECERTRSFAADKRFGAYRGRIVAAGLSPRVARNETARPQRVRGPRTVPRVKPGKQKEDKIWDSAPVKARRRGWKRRIQGLGHEPLSRKARAPALLKPCLCKSRNAGRAAWTGPHLILGCLLILSTHSSEDRRRIVALGRALNRINFLAHNHGRDEANVEQAPSCTGE